MFNPEGKNRLYLFFTCFILLQVFFLLFSESTYGYGGLENIFQYRNAKFSFEYPELLFGSNPFYTLLLAPFSKFGYLPAKAFNIMLATFTLLFSARIVNKLFPGSELFMLVLIAFSPVFFRYSASCLPDVLFGFLLVAAIYLFISKQILFSALVISFIPFVLPQGFLLLLVFAVVIILNRTYRFIPFLLAGTVLYSFTGFIVFGNFLWFFQIINENFEGSRNFLQHAQNILSLIGIPLTILAVAGLIFQGYEIFKKVSMRNQNTHHFILIAGSGLIFMVFTFFFRERSFSHGFETATGAVIPLFAITGVKMFDVLAKNFKNKNLAIILLSVFALFQVVQLFAQNNLLIKATQEEQLMKKSAAYLLYNEPESKLIYFNPLLAHFLELDPFKESLSVRSGFHKQQPSNTMDWGDVLVWDSWSGGNREGPELQPLENDPYLKKIMSFKPIGLETDSTQNGCSVHIFKKAENKKDSEEVSDHYKSVLSFEKYLDERVKEVDGFKVWELDSSQDYSPSIRFSPEVVIRQDFYEITATLHFKALQPIDAAEVLLVFSAESAGGNLHYKKADLISAGDKWEQLHLNVEIPSDMPESTQFLIYIWNKDRKNVLMEKIAVVVKSY